MSGESAYHDGVASDVLAAFVSHPGNRAQIYDSASLGPWLRLDGRLPLTPEQHLVVSALIPPERGGTAPDGTPAREVAS